MRVEHLRMWLEQFNPTEDVIYEMDCFHPSVILKVKRNSKDYTFNLNTGRCYIPTKDKEIIYDPHKYDYLKGE